VIYDRIKYGNSSISICRGEKLMEVKINIHFDEISKKEIQQQLSKGVTPEEIVEQAKITLS
jgi:hypothetical protein